MAPVQTSPGSFLASLTEADDLSSFRSEYYTTGLVLGPEFARYEIYATVDGVPVVFSDDPAVSPRAAGVGEPIRAYFQAADMNVSTGEITDARVIQSLEPNLDANALIAAKAWKFLPGTKDGEAIPVVVTLIMEYRVH